MKKLIIIGAALFLAVTILIGLSTPLYADQNIYTFDSSTLKQGYVPNEIIIKFKKGARDSDIKNLKKAFKLLLRKKGQYGKFHVFRIPEGSRLESLLENMKAKGIIEYAEPNFYYSMHMVPNDPLYPYQWHMDNALYGGINMEAAWDIQTGSSGVIVAVLDTGVAYENYRQGWNRYYLAPDLANTTFVPGYDFVNNDTHPNDDNAHGTHVTGTIAQSTNNNSGVAGVAFNTAIMPVKVLDYNGNGTADTVADGIIYAADNWADVINMSLGGPIPSQTIAEACAYAYDHGVTIVASAGNDGTDQVGYPAAYDDYVIAVGATRYNETLAPYSNFGPSLDLVAPGGDLYGFMNGDGYPDGVLQCTFNPQTKQRNDFGYWFYQGTSMAAPHVSGVAALLIANGVTGADSVRNAMETTTEDLGDPGWDATFGWGLVDAYAALNSESCPDNDEDGYTDIACGGNDCDDVDPDVNPDAIEVCDGIDNNCDGQADEGVISTFYQDADGDGYGDPTKSIQACTIQSGYVEDAGDCDDTDPQINPGATEVCNGIDDDCDGTIDEGLTSTFYLDADEDGYGDPTSTAQACSCPIGYVENADDCDDTDPAIYPGATEVCNGIDDDCDGNVDEGFTTTTYYRDADGDTYGNLNNSTQACSCPTGYVTNDEDCDDNNNAVNPDAQEVCNGIDDDCDDTIDEGFDQDKDGYTNCAGDCDDNNDAVNPDAQEVCNGIDDDCDGNVDEGVTTTFYQDADEDGYGDPTSTTQACSCPTGYVTNDEDCDDDNGAVNPDAGEVCDGIDNNCDGTIDEGCTPTAYTNIDMSKRTYWIGWWRATAVITVQDTDASGPVIGGAIVNGRWSGAYSRSVSGTTGSDGTVSFQTGLIRNSGSATFTIDEVIKDGTLYIPSGETNDSI